MRARQLWAVVGLLYIAACSSPEETRARFVSKGDEYFAVGQYEKARIEYLNALKIDSKDAPARYGAGQAFEKLGSYRQALGHYVGATEADPAHFPSRIALGRLFVLSRSAARAAEHVDAVLAIDASHLDALALKASIHALEGRIDESLALAQQVVAADPANAIAVPLLTSQLMSRDLADQARAVIDAAIAQAPDAVGFRGVNAQLLWQLGNEDAFLAEMRRIIDLEPGVPAHVLNYVQALQRADRDDAALAALRDHASRNAAPLLLQQRYLAYLAERDPAAVTSAYQSLLPNAADADALRMSHAEFLARQGRLDEARGILAGLAATEGSRHALDARVELARIDAQSGNTSVARAAVDSVLADSPTNERALRLAVAMDKATGELDKAIAGVRLLLRDSPSEIAFYRELGDLYERAGSTRLARDAYASGLKVAPSEESLLRPFAATALTLQEYDQALSSADRLLQMQADDFAALGLRYRALMGQAKFDEAIAVARTISAAAPDRGLGAFYQALVHLEQDDRGAAEKALRKSVSVQPGTTEPLATLVRLLVAAEREDEVEQLLAAQAQRSESPFIEKLQGDVLVRKGQRAEAKAHYASLIADHPDYATGYRVLAALHRQDEEVAEARAVLERGANATGSAGLYLEYALALQADRQFDQAIALYRSVAERFPGDTRFANNLAMLIAEYRDSPANLAEARDLTQRFQSMDDPALLDTYGWVRFKLQDYDSAVQALRRASELAPGSGLVRYHLGKALIGSGDRERALKQFRLATTNEQQFSGRDDALRLVAELSNS